MVVDFKKERIETSSKPQKRHLDGISMLLCLIVAILWCLPMEARAFRYLNEDEGHDFILIGLGVFRQNYTSTQGPDDLFEDSDDGLPQEYSNRSRLSLYGEGQIFHDYTFLLKGNYDEESSDAAYENDLTVLLELYKDKHFLILGDHEDGTFQDTMFTALDERIRGMTLHTGFSKAGATMMAGALRGETASDEIRGDGTSGPYRLEEAPVIEGSETVTIEIRDRSNPNSVIQRETLSRGQDYSIDYDDGEITFDSPVQEQDFRGNPTFIVVTYQFDAPGDRFQRAAWGTRFTAEPSDALRMGVSYLADGPFDDWDIDNAMDQRRQIYGTDLAVNFSERYHLGIEVARSEVPELENASESDATVVNLDANPVDPLHVYGRYWRVERDFLTFGNLNLQSDNVVDEIDLDEPFSFKSASLEFDLDPNISVTHGTDEESYGLSAAYHFNPEHALSAGFRETQNNIPDLEDTPQLTTRSLFSAYKRISPEATNWLLAVENITNEDDESPKTLETTTNRILGALKHPLGTYRYLGDTYLQFAYQFEDFSDDLESENDAQIHDALLRAEVHPLQEVTVYGEQAEQLIYEEFDDDYTYRTDTSMIGVEGIFNRYVDLDFSARYGREVDLIEDRTSETEQIYTFRWTSRPFDTLKSRLKFEYRESDDKISQTVRTRNIYGGELFWDVVSNLLATVKYEYETDESNFPESSDETSTYDDLLLRLDYKFRRSLSLYGAYRLETDEVEAPPLDITTSDTTTWLLGAKYQINDEWDFLSSYKDKRVDGAIEDHRQKFFAELGYKFSRFIKVALGYEYIDFNDEESGESFETNVGYISLTGTL